MYSLRPAPALLLSWALLASSLTAQQPAAAQPPAPSQATITVDVDEVIVDVIVRDRRGKLITDLKPEEIEILEDGAKQKLTGLRLIEGKEAVAQNQQRVTLDPLRQMRLVSLVFERLGPEAMKLARDSALELIKRENEPSVYFAVFRLEGAIRILQPFTRDKNLLRRAVEQATSGAGTKLQASSQGPQEPTAPKAGKPEQQSGPGLAAQGGDFAEQAMQRALQRMEQYMDAMTREQQGSMSLTSLMALVKGQQALAGRKTGLYFTEWFNVPEAQDMFYRNLIGEANRTNFSFYVVDAKGLTTWSQAQGGADALRDMVRETERVQTSTANNANLEPDRNITDRQVAATRSNPQLFMQELATSTGGFLIGDTNDFRKPLERVVEDIWTYYEASYKPENRNMDGRYRTLAVKVNRPNLVVQGRAGYFALPSAFRDVLFPWEVPLLRSLTATPLPRDIDYRAQAFRFGFQNGLTKGVLSVEVPLANIGVNKAEARKSFSAHFSMIAMIKDAQGQVVRKFQRDLPVVRDLNLLANYQAGNFTFAEPFELPPGRYNLEVAVMDWTSSKLGAKRSSFSLPGASNASSISSLALIRKVDPVQGADPGTDPFRFEKGKVTPDLGGKIASGPNAQIWIYCVIYTGAGAQLKPQLFMEFSKDGQILGKAEAPLPEPDGTGKMPYIAQIPAATWPTGQFEVRAILVQGGREVGEERLTFAIE